MSSRSSRRKRKKRHSQVKSIFRLLLGFWVITVFLFRDHLSSFFPEQTPSFNLSQPDTLFNSSEIIGGKTDSLNADNFQNIDEKVFRLNYQGKSIQELANLLSSLAETEAEKARSIYTWIADDIAYDVEMSLGNLYFADVRATTVLETRQTICSGYANLYKALAKAMGLDAAIIEGTATGASYVVGESTINHAWNAVKIEGQWYLLDVTWGAGIVEDNQFQKRFNPYYFATPPEQLIFDHFPANGVWQLLETPYTQKEFQDLPTVSPALFEKNIDLVSHPKKAITIENSTEIILSVPEEIVVTTKLKKNDRPLSDQYNLIQRQGENVIIHTAFPEAGKYELEIFANAKQSETYPHILTYQITANYANAPFPETFLNFQENDGYLYSPLTGELTANQTVQFKLKVENAVDVQVIDVARNRWTKLTRLDNLFMGNVKVNNSLIAVVAQFPNDSRYWTLLQYN